MTSATPHSRQSPAFTTPSLPIPFLRPQLPTAISALPCSPAHITSPRMVAQASRRARGPSASPRASPSRPPALPGVVSHPVPSLPNWRYAGPVLDASAPEPLPAVVYFALSAQQSLELAPFNEFARFALANGDADTAARATHASDAAAPLRVFSVDLPFHGTMEENEDALRVWAERYEEGGDVVSFFTRRVSKGLDRLIEMGFVEHGEVYVAGLSRGGLLAAHLALANSAVAAVLGFSPVTNLGDVAEFREVWERARREEPGGALEEKLRRASLQTDEALEGLSNVAVRFYSGNLDRRVGTRNSFEFMARLAEVAASKDVRSPPHEYVMFCSLGREGHGTSSDVFCVGARWLLRRAGLRL